MQEAFNIVNLFYDAAIRNPGKTAIIYRGNKITFTDFEQQVTATANYFLSRGIKKGDKVLIFIPMSINLYRVVLALFKIGAVAVFLDEWVNRKRLDACCEVVQCKGIIGNFKVKLLSLFSAELRKIPVKLSTDYFQGKINIPTPVTNNEDTALITFTTGSTGVPKAAKRTHGFLFEQFAALKQKIKPHADEIDMPVLPIVLLINLAAGVTSVIADYKANKPHKLKPAKIVEQLKRYKVNRIIASPFFVKEISKYVIEHNLALPQLKKIFTGGAPVFPSEAAIYDKAFSKAAIEIVYGSTESEPISGISVKELLKEKDFTKGLNVGKVDKCAQVKLIQITDAPVSASSSEELTQLNMPFGEIGEIIVTGKHVLREYFNNEQAILRNKIFIGDECWHRTGDSGYFDEKGNLRLTGRCNTLIYFNDKIISPFTYENYFQTVKGIEIGTILKRNEKLVAIIEPLTDNYKDDIKHLINTSNLGISEISFIKKIPRDPRHNSKIDYQKLVAMVPGQQS